MCFHSPVELALKTRITLFICLLLGAPISLYAATPTAMPAISLSLAQAQALMLTHSRDLLAAQRNVEAAQATQLTAATRPNPQISLNTSSVNPRNLGAGGLTDKRMDTVLRIDQAIERGDKRELRMKTAQQLAISTPICQVILRRQP